MSTRPSFDVYVSPYKLIPPSVPGWDPSWTATWPATTSTLIRFGDEAVLVDALMTQEEGTALGAWVGERATRLNVVFVTHAHADHFFGATALLPGFPDAELVATPQVAEDAAEQVQPGYLAVWETFFPGQLAASPVVPRALTGDLRIQSMPLHVVEVGSSDVPHSTVLHVPDLDLVVAGDVAYNGVHMWMAGSDHAGRTAWLEALDLLEKLGAQTVIAGHRDPAAVDDEAARLLDESRQYIQDFDVAATEADSAADLVARMMSKHEDSGNPYTLWVAADSQFEQSQEGGE